MENTVRSERSRNAAIQAALAIVARDGPGRLTLDAIAREGKISKGGLMHQFPTKKAVLQAMLDYRTEHFEKFSRDYLSGPASASSEPNLAAQIATWREALSKPNSIALALLAALAEDPGLLSSNREIDAKKLEIIKAEAADPDLAVLRWLAASGLVMTALLGLCPLSEAERARLFDRLLDTAQWPVPAKSAKPRPARPARTSKRSAR